MKLSPTYPNQSQATTWSRCADVSPHRASMSLDTGGLLFGSAIQAAKTRPAIARFVTILAGQEPGHNLTKEAGR